MWRSKNELRKNTFCVEHRRIESKSRLILFTIYIRIYYRNAFVCLKTLPKNKQYYINLLMMIQWKTIAHERKTKFYEKIKMQTHFYSVLHLKCVIFEWKNRCSNIHSQNWTDNPVLFIYSFTTLNTGDFLIITWI